jgi:hypothetical protein
MTYVKWERTATGWRSVQGRFEIGQHSTRSGYLGLTDHMARREYVCRTEDSAKTIARNLVKISTVR